MLHYEYQVISPGARFCNPTTLHHAKKILARTSFYEDVRKLDHARTAERISIKWFPVPKESLLDSPESILRMLMR